jgi:inositol-phosphate phosphatase / L-galactose 1-phosphate phosphatase / histidinol-phosphatase
MPRRIPTASASTTHYHSDFMPESTPEPDEAFLETAIALADIARRTTRIYFRRPLDIDRKADRSPVTVADRETERLMRELIDARHDDHGIVGEEFGTRKAKSAWTWILDPIDGTKSFISGKPIFGSLISLVHGSTPVLGVIEIPCQEERWVGIRGRATTFNGAPCTVSTVSTLDDAVMLATTPDMFDAPDWALFEHISRRARARAFGTDCYGYGLLAAGFCDAVMEADLKPYDYMALVPVIEGAGGIITDWSGGTLNVASDGRVLACSGRQLHGEILELIRTRHAVPA